MIGIWHPTPVTGLSGAGWDGSRDRGVGAGGIDSRRTGRGGAVAEYADADGGSDRGAGTGENEWHDRGTGARDR